MKQEALEDNGADKSVFSDKIRAGQRTYYFDVKVNRNNHYYLVITESKKRVDNRGRSVFEKFKIHLYHENIVAFSECLHQISDFLITNNSQQLLNESENYPDLD